MLLTEAPDPPTYFVGIDLAIRATHLAVVIDRHGRRVGANIRFGHGFDEHERMYQLVTQRLPQDADIVWAAEPSGGVWMPSAAFFTAHGDTLSLQKPTKVADLRKYLKRHLKTDQVDAQTIAETVRLDTERGLALNDPPQPKLQAQRSIARRIEALHRNVGSAKNRLKSQLCHSMLPDLATTKHDWCAASMLRVLHHFADLIAIAESSRSAFIRSAMGSTKGGARTSRQALEALHLAARDSWRVFGPEGMHWQAYGVMLQETIQAIWDLHKRIDTLQEQLDALVEEDCPDQVREAGLSVPGVGPYTLHLLMAFFGPPHRWPDFAGLKQYGGLVPIIDATGASEKAFVMSKLGEPIIRKLVHQMGDTARQHDAEFAACYYDKMVNKGKRHTGACIAAGLKLLNVLRSVLRSATHYQPRDPETKHPITKQHSRQLAKTTYVVPKEIRNQRRIHKRNDETQSDGCVKDVPEALPEPCRN